MIAFGAILAINFTLFWVFGAVLIQEANTAILVLELAMSIAIFGFGVERLASCIRDRLALGSHTDGYQATEHQVPTANNPGQPIVG